MNELSNVEKSRILIRLVGWEVEHRTSGNLLRWRKDSSIIAVIGANDYINLYHVKHMELAWRVLNWAEENKWIQFLPESLFELEPDEAQTFWLDTILETAIFAGLAEY